jgi:Oligosaccharyltransferase 48 kDa subunit beta
LPLLMLLLQHNVAPWNSTKYFTAVWALQGNFSTKFKVPDVYGVFKFVIQYSEPGYNHIELLKQIPVRIGSRGRVIVWLLPVVVSWRHNWMISPVAEVTHLLLMLCRCSHSSMMNSIDF